MVTILIKEKQRVTRFNTHTKIFYVYLLTYYRHHQLIAQNTQHINIIQE